MGVPCMAQHLHSQEEEYVYVEKVQQHYCYVHQIRWAALEFRLAALPHAHQQCELRSDSKCPEQKAETITSLLTLGCQALWRVHLRHGGSQCPLCQPQWPQCLYCVQNLDSDRRIQIHLPLGLSCILHQC